MLPVEGLLSSSSFEEQAQCALVCARLAKALDSGSMCIYHKTKY